MRVFSDFSLWHALMPERHYPSLYLALYKPITMLLHAVTLSNYLMKAWSDVHF
jgi:hypothetical protein